MVQEQKGCIKGCILAVKPGLSNFAAAQSEANNESVLQSSNAWPSQWRKEGGALKQSKPYVSVGMLTKANHFQV